METSERTGRHGKSISTGKSMEEGSGTERRGRILTGTATTKEEAKEDTTIKPILAAANESPGK